MATPDRPVLAARSRRSSLVVLGVLVGLTLAAPAAVAHFDWGFRVVGPNTCELEWASNHTSSAYSAETIESSRSSAQFGCRGVAGRVRYYTGSGWTTRYQSDTTKPYDVFLNGNHSYGYAYSDHIGKNYQDSAWYTFKSCHQGPC